MNRKTILQDIAPRLKKLRETLAALPPEIRELVTQMEQVPVLKYEILLNFHKFKESQKETVLEETNHAV